jgi:hypothetical protein
MHDGHTPRALHENGTRPSSPQRRQAKRKNPCDKSPQRKRPGSSSATNGARDGSLASRLDVPN